MTYDIPPWADKDSYDAGFDDGREGETARIRAAIGQRCGLDRITLAGIPFRCGLNKGHIGDCSAFSGTLTITRERLYEILDG